MMELLVLEIGSTKFGLDASCIREVQRAAALSSLPQAAAAIEGALNLRGELVPVIELRRLVGQGSKPIALTDHFVVIAASATVAGVRVDRAVELVASDQLETAADAAPVGDTKLVTQTVRVRDEFVHVLDSERLIVLCHSQNIGFGKSAGTR